MKKNVLITLLILVFAFLNSCSLMNEPENNLMKPEDINNEADSENSDNNDERKDQNNENIQSVETGAADGTESVESNAADNQENSEVGDDKDTEDSEASVVENPENGEDLNSGYEIVYPDKERVVVSDSCGIGCGLSCNPINELADESELVVRGTVSAVSDAKFFNKEYTIGTSFITLSVDEVLAGNYHESEVTFGIPGGYMKIEDYYGMYFIEYNKDNKKILNDFGIDRFDEEHYDYYIFENVNNEIYPEIGNEYIVFLRDHNIGLDFISYYIERLGFSVLKVTDEGVFRNMETEELRGIVNIGSLDEVIKEIQNNK
jgi:hypothetical protein